MLRTMIKCGFAVFALLLAACGEIGMVEPEPPAASTTAFLTVDSDPRGAHVTIGRFGSSNAPRVLVTPDTATVASGTYDISYALAGYGTRSRLRTFRGGDSVDVHEDLRRVLTDADVLVSVVAPAVVDSITTLDRSGARTVYSRASISRDTILPLRVVDGEGHTLAYAFHASAAGYYSDVIRVVTGAGEPAQAVIRLAAVPKPEDPDPVTGELNVWSAPTGARFTLLNSKGTEVVATGTTDTTLTLSGGCRRVLIELDGYIPLEDVECVNEGLRSDIGGILSPIAAPLPTPTIRITANPGTVVFPGTTQVCVSVENVSTALVTHVGGLMRFDPAVAETRCFEDAPPEDRVYVALAVGPGGSAEDSASVVVTAPPQKVLESVSCQVEKEILNRTGQRDVELCSVTLPAGVDSVWVSVHVKYSGAGQTNEAFAIALEQGSVRRFTYPEGQDCPVVPDDPALHGLTWREAGKAVGVPGGVVKVHAYHAWLFFDGTLGTCYRQNGNWTAETIQFRNDGDDETERAVIVSYLRDP